MLTVVVGDCSLSLLLELDKVGLRSESRWVPAYPCVLGSPVHTYIDPAEGQQCCNRLLIHTEHVQDIQVSSRKSASSF